MATMHDDQHHLTASELASVLLKILGIYWIVSAVLMVPNVLALRSMTGEQYDGVPGSETVFTTQLLTAVFVFGVGASLLLATRSVVRALFSGPREPAPPIGSSSLQAVGFSLIGVWLLAYALPTLASNGVVLLALSKGGRELERAGYLEANWTSLLPPFFEAAIGLWLLLGARRLSAAWHGRGSGEGDDATS
ncbi:MAG: hypothetical protein OES32_09825 [Acidobacteriota bacterium]|nr:hypothetical protein [Acidobacteriota bacterium]